MGFRESDFMSMENRVISGFSVSDKASSTTKQSDVGLGLMLLQPTESIPVDNNKMRMMVYSSSSHGHHHHHRPFSSPYERIGDGPTCSRSVRDIYDVAGGVAAASANGGAAVIRTLQPFDISSTAATVAANTALKSPAGGMMAASLGYFPFTNAQWKELERQAMIYKYMMASVPVPPDLLSPITRNLSDPAAASHSNLDSRGSVFNLRYTNNKDSEPGRCRRTDGKKWRCSRDVAPDRKYCERHMHRGRPRSRKPVELHPNFNNNNNNSTSTAPKINSTSTCSSSAQYLGSTSHHPYDQTPLFLCKSDDKVSPFESVVSVSSYKEPRSLEWMMKEAAVPMATADQQWHDLMQTKIGLTTEPSFCDTYGASVFQQNCKEVEPLNLNEMGLIDAWSNAVTEDHNNVQNSNNSVSSSNGDLSLSSLALSMASHNNTLNDEMGQTQMGLGIIQSAHHNNKPQISNWLTPSSSSSSSWVAQLTPGGPLAEVLRPSTVFAGAGSGSNPASPIAGNGDSGSSPPATAVSSPSGVLQKTQASMSDSSANSSPAEIGVQWLNHSKLGSSSSWV